MDPRLFYEYFNATHDDPSVEKLLTIVSPAYLRRVCDRPPVQPPFADERKRVSVRGKEKDAYTEKQQRRFGLRQDREARYERWVTREVTTISDLCSWTLTLVYVGWCYGGYHGDAVHVETAALDRNCRRACAEIYIKDINFYSYGRECG